MKLTRKEERLVAYILNFLKDRANTYLSLEEGYDMSSHKPDISEKEKNEYEVQRLKYMVKKNCVDDLYQDLMHKFNMEYTIRLLGEFNKSQDKRRF